MAGNLAQTVKKLILALSTKGYKLTYNVKQFMGVEGEPHNYYSICQAVWDDDKHKYLNQELYSSTSMVRIVLFLRDMWYEVNGQELPTDQEKWNDIRKQMREKKNG
jgi:hypothetical protein